MRGESSNWSSYASLVRDRILHQAEGPTLDKKREHYYFDEGMTDDDGKPVDHHKKRADFLKDLIALANAARRQNEDAYLCLGIAEFDDWTIFGIEGRHPKRDPTKLSLTLLVQLLQDQDFAVQRAVIQAIETAHYLPAADALYNIGKPAQPELQWQIASMLIKWGDPRGEELQPGAREEVEKTENEQLVTQPDKEISSEPLEINILASTGG